MHLERGIVKNNCPWGVSFEQQVVQIPTHAREGGLNIDRCIRYMDKISVIYKWNRSGVVALERKWTVHCLRFTIIPPYRTKHWREKNLVVDLMIANPPKFYPPMFSFTMIFSVQALAIAK